MFKSKPKNLAPVIIVIIIILGFALFFAYQKYFVVATVNGKPISRLTVIKELEDQGGKNVLENIITRELILQEAAKKNTSANQNEINSELKKIEENVKSQGGTLDAALKQKGMTKEELMEEIRIQIIVKKLIQADKIKITDKQVDKYIKDNPQMFPADSKEKPPKDEIKQQLYNQQLQQKIEKFVTDIKAKAKINYNIKY